MEDLFDEELAATYIYDPTEQEQAADNSPTVIVKQGEKSYSESDRRKLQRFVKAAEALQGTKDKKLQTLIFLVKDLLKDGFNPIIWCRYIATAKYVAEALRPELENKKGSNIRVICIDSLLLESSQRMSEKFVLLS